MDPPIGRNSDDINTEDIPGMSHMNLAEARVEPEPQKPEPVKKVDLQPSDFFFGTTLGEGAFARVVHARMKKSPTPEFAIKIMEKGHIKKENKVKYVMMEKTILSRVSHAFIIRFYFSFQDTGYLYMCMELAPGGELLGLIVQQRKANEEKGIMKVACTEATTRFYIAELAEALEYLHGQDIIHRDMKPENVLITASGHVKVTDFGTSLLGQDEDTSRSSFVGTAEYVSPEVLKTEQVGRGCDLWALGCMTYQMLVGKTPFHDETEYLIFEKIRAHCDGGAAVQYPPAVSAHAISFIENMLQTDSEGRYGAGEEGSASSYSALKAHALFAGLPWGALINTPAPYVPDPASFPSPDNMKDGAEDDWFFDGEATPIGQESDDSFDKSSKRAAASKKSAAPADTPGTFHQFLMKDEKQVFTGIVQKRKGLFSKKRQLILTDAPRLFYIDAEKMEFKGQIPWTSTHPVGCIVLNKSAFDVVCTETGRRYHLSDSVAGAQMWVELINAMLEKQRESKH